jgi:hypothetical protein
MDDPAGNVEEGLVVGEEQRDQQRRTPMIQVRCPDHLITCTKLHDVGDEVQQGWFVVGNSL